jgi:hypothetical protein
VQVQTHSLPLREFSFKTDPFFAKKLIHGGMSVTPVVAEEKDDLNKAIDPRASTPQTGIRNTLMRLFTRHSTSEITTQPPSGPKRMLTCGQLSDLFRRLDKDGNGELDLEEFTQIISKLKINVSEEFVTR